MEGEKNLDSNSSSSSNFHYNGLLQIKAMDQGMSINPFKCENYDVLRLLGLWNYILYVVLEHFGFKTHNFPYRFFSLYDRIFEHE